MKSATIVMVKARSQSMIVIVLKKVLLKTKQASF